MRIIILGLALSVCVALNASAATFGGSGVQACKIWVDDRNAENSSLHADESWVMGFLSGIAYSSWVGGDPLSGVDADRVYSFMDMYCADHPADTMTVAAEAFYRSHPHAPNRP